MARRDQLTARTVEVDDGIWQVSGGEFPSNNYVCVDPAGEGCTIVDLGLDLAPLQALLDRLGVVPRAILCTHGHFDHVGQASVLQDRYDVPVYLHRDDVGIAQRNNFLLMAMKLSARVTLPRFTLCDDGFAVDAAGRGFSYRHAPGHTPGSCIVTHGSRWFTGDTLYARGIGLSRLPGERTGQLRTTIAGLWDELDGHLLLPGHGAVAAGTDVKRTNLALREFMGIDPALQVQHG